MITKKHTALVALAACALALVALGSAKNPVTRPMKADANAIITLHFDTLTWEMSDWGEATHLGLWTDTGSGELDEVGNMLNGSGTIVTANKDKIFWVLSPTGGSVYTGGTGRFQGVTGGAEFAWISGPDPIYSDNATLILVGIYTVVDGEITY